MTWYIAHTAMNPNEQQIWQLQTQLILRSKDEQLLENSATLEHRQQEIELLRQELAQVTQLFQEEIQEKERQIEIREGNQQELNQCLHINVEVTAQFQQQLHENEMAIQHQKEDIQSQAQEIHPL